jgi:hypothetical protein
MIASPATADIRGSMEIAGVGRAVPRLHGARRPGRGSRRGTAPQNVKTWISGWQVAAGGWNVGGWPFFDYGSANGCPESGSSVVSEVCEDKNAKAGSWSQDDIAFISYLNGSAIPLPEIYSAGNAAQWQQLDRLIGTMFRKADERHARAFQADGRAITGYGCSS